jgi:hypothetical protein
MPEKECTIYCAARHARTRQEALPLVRSNLENWRGPRHRRGRRHARTTCRFGVPRPRRAWSARIAARSRRRRGDTLVSSEGPASLFDIRERTRYPVPPVGDIKVKSRATGSRVRVASSSHLAACCRQSVTFSDGLISIAGSVCPGWCAYARASRLTIRNAANSMAENSMAEKDLTCGWKRRFFTARKKVAIVLSLVWRQRAIYPLEEQPPMT